jgi:hypothetical protein
VFCWRKCCHWFTCFIGNQCDSTENADKLDPAINETSTELKLSPSQRFSRRLAIGELEKYVKDGLTSGELQRQHAVSIIHQPVSFWNCMAVQYCNVRLVNRAQEAGSCGWVQSASLYSFTYQNRVNHPALSKVIITKTSSSSSSSSSNSSNSNSSRCDYMQKESRILHDTFCSFRMKFHSPI